MSIQDSQDLCLWGAKASLSKSTEIAIRIYTSDQNVVLQTPDMHKRIKKKKVVQIRTKSQSNQSPTECAKHTGSTTSPPNNPQFPKHPPIFWWNGSLWQSRRLPCAMSISSSISVSWGSVPHVTDGDWGNGNVFWSNIYLSLTNWQSSLV